MSKPLPGRGDLIRQVSVQRYRRRAAAYDETCAPTWAFRERAIANLALVPGDVVLDVGCGTGLSFELLRNAVGPTGSVIGVDQSPDMAARARERVLKNGWDNVTVIVGPAHEVKLPQPVGAMLFNYTHDICRCRASLSNLFGQALPRARVGMAGIKFFPRWLAPLNFYVYLKNFGYNGKPGELRTPWDIVQEYATDLQVEPTQWGMGFVARGRVQGPPA